MGFFLWSAFYIFISQANLVNEILKVRYLFVKMTKICSEIHRKSNISYVSNVTLPPAGNIGRSERVLFRHIHVTIFTFCQVFTNQFFVIEMKLLYTKTFSWKLMWSSQVEYFQYSLAITIIPEAFNLAQFSYKNETIFCKDDHEKSYQYEFSCLALLRWIF